MNLEPCIPIFSSTLAIFGTAMAAWGVRTILRAWASRRWPTAPGIILTSEIVAGGDSESSSYKAMITYAYVVDGVEHRGDTLAVGMNHISGWLKSEERHVKKYPAGATVSVAYDPADPRVAVLEAGLSLRNWWQLGYALPFLIGGAGLTISWLRRH